MTVRAGMVGMVDRTASGLLHGKSTRDTPDSLMRHAYRQFGR
jgi:hypothetical protein